MLWPNYKLIKKHGHVGNFSENRNKTFKNVFNGHYIEMVHRIDFNTFPKLVNNTNKIQKQIGLQYKQLTILKLNMFEKSVNGKPRISGHIVDMMYFAHFYVGGHFLNQ